MRVTRSLSDYGSRMTLDFLRLRLRSRRTILPLRHSQLRGRFYHSTMAEAEPKPSKQPPAKLSMKDYRVYNSMAEHMEYFVPPLAQ